jgi:hypothetical protein
MVRLTATVVFAQDLLEKAAFDWQFELQILLYGLTLHTSF